MNETKMNNPSMAGTVALKDPMKKQKMHSSNTLDDSDENNDPITGTPGAHPVGTGLGAIAAGAAVGAAGGVIGGPIGAVAGAIVGAVAGGVAGSAAAEVVNPTVETEYWREEYPGRSYSDSKLGFEEYEPAYRYGWESFVVRQGRAGGTFDSVERDLGRGWDQAKGSSHLVWDQAREASRDAWNRMQSADGSAGAPITAG